MTRKFSFIFAAVFVLCCSCYSADASPDASLDAAAWLHVDGRHIKDAAGNIFIPLGAAYIASDTIYGNPEDNLAWCKKVKINTIRISMREEEAHEDVDAYITKHVDPIIQACKLYGIYAYLDQHNYFHEYTKEDTWLPQGDVWGKERVKVWADNWKKIAQRYKDEPWVLGYELLNEPYGMPGDQVQAYYMEALKAIREVDTKHIILLGTCDYTHTMKMKETWGDIKFKPDEPYNNVVFAFHEYTRAYDPMIAGPILDGIIKKYNVPVMCTEFGSDETVPGTTVDERRKFETDMFAMMKERQIGWSIWRLMGTYPDITCRWDDLWQPAMADAMPTQVVMKGNIECAVSGKNIIADNKTPVTVTAVLKDFEGKTPAAGYIQFIIKGDAVLEGENPASAVNGSASIKVKFARTGQVDILAVSRGYYHGSANVTGIAGKAAKIACTAEPLAKQEDGSALSKVTASIVDAYGNTVSAGAVYRVNCGGPEYIDSKGQLWLCDQLFLEGGWGYTAKVKISPDKMKNKINNTDDEKLFYSRSKLSDTAGYKFTVPNGKYRVEMGFVEVYHGVRNNKKEGARVFDVMIEGEPAIKDLDVYSKAGNFNALTETCSVEVKDGVLDIFAVNKVDNAEIRSISITPETPAEAPAKVTFSHTSAGAAQFTLEGINPAEPVGGMAVITLKKDAAMADAPAIANVEASFPGLVPGTARIQ
ncbi:MAG: hypothetical protein A2297_04430 [Elusimicrobia bacterium RIFOXYB2_FULL_48_7]|nr:MAG: hypothetical protein A2297_04430 [Elusimicrobia bacterium RIFOXYB2_FULL_48_7]